MMIRSTRKDDIVALQEVLDGVGLFPSEMLPDMVESFLSGQDCADIWLSCESGGRAVGFCYAAPEAFAAGAWNMLAIAVLPTEQGKGLGGGITGHLETLLTGRRQRILIAETSGLEAFAPTRAFYRKLGFVEEARIRDFWATGDDKVVFWKSLVSRAQ